MDLTLQVGVAETTIKSQLGMQRLMATLAPTARPSV